MENGSVRTLSCTIDSFSNHEGYDITTVSSLTYDRPYQQFSIKQLFDTSQLITELIYIQKQQQPV